MNTSGSFRVIKISPAIAAVVAMNASMIPMFVDMITTTFIPTWFGRLFWPRPEGTNSDANQ